MEIIYHEIKENERKDFKKFYKTIKKMTKEEQERLLEEYSRNRKLSASIIDDEVHVTTI